MNFFKILLKKYCGLLIFTTFCLWVFLFGKIFSIKPGTDFMLSVFIKLSVILGLFLTNYFAEKNRNKLQQKITKK